MQIVNVPKKILKINYFHRKQFFYTKNWFLIIKFYCYFQILINNAILFNTENQK